MSLLREMPGAGVQPNEVSYSAAISACEKAGRCDEALSLLREMPAAGVQPNVSATARPSLPARRLAGGRRRCRCLNARCLLQACGQTSSATARPSLRARRQASGRRRCRCCARCPMRACRPDVISYSAAISACEKAGRCDAALSLFQTMREDDVRPDVISYSAAISACEKAGRCDEALSLFQTMREDDVRPDVISYSAAISACEKAGQWEKALSLLREMPAAGVAARRDQLQRRHLGVREGWPVR